MPLTQRDIRKLFELLNEDLTTTGTHAELFLVGGAVMCIAYASQAEQAGTGSGGARCGPGRPEFRLAE